MTTRMQAGAAALVMSLWTGVALAQFPCPAGTVLVASAASAAAGTLTIAPNGGIESFAGEGLIVEVCITCDGAPLPGVPAPLITVGGPGLVFCPFGNIADGPTDAFGCTFFTGPLEGGGCAPALDVFVAGLYIATVPIAINSPDTGTASPLFVDASDLARLAPALGAAGLPCLDWDEDGFIAAGDIAYMAALLGADCP